MVSTTTWALQAAHWAIKPYPADPSINNFDAWFTRVLREARKPGKVTLMRNQISMGMNNNYWPCMSRLAIMRDPWLAHYIHPRHVIELDCPEGIDLLNKLYETITHAEPKVRDWQQAKKVIA